MAGIVASHISLARPLPLSARPTQSKFEEPFRYGGALTVGLGTIQTLDSQAALDVNSQQVISCIGEGLYGFDRQGYLIPALAKYLPEQKGELTWIIRLREGLKFHDGENLDARAVIYTFYRLKNVRADDPIVNTIFGNIKSLEPINKTTIRVTLHKPDALLGYMFARQELYPLSPRQVERYGNKYGTVTAAGAGPFRLSELISGEKLVLERFEGYWDKERPYIQKIVFKFRETETERLHDLSRRRIRVLMNLSPKAASALRKKKKYWVKGVPGKRLMQLYLNTERPPFSNPRTRQALAYAIDRKSLADKLYLGWAGGSNSLFPPWHWAHRPEFSGLNYSPEKSRELLLSIRPPLRFPIKFSLLYTQEQRFAGAAWLLKKQLEEAGFDLRLKPLPKPEMLDYLYGRGDKDRNEFSAALEDWGGNPHPDSYSYLLYHSGSSYNKVCYSDYLVDKLLDEAKSISIQEKMRPFYYLVEDLVTQDANTIYLCLPDFIFAYSGIVRDISSTPSGLLDFSRAWLKK